MSTAIPILQHFLNPDFNFSTGPGYSRSMDGKSALLIGIYNLFLSPHSHILSRIGIKDLPRSVRLYSTLGGICGYSSL